MQRPLFQCWWVFLVGVTNSQDALHLGGAGSTAQASLVSTGLSVQPTSSNFEPQFVHSAVADGNMLGNAAEAHAQHYASDAVASSVKATQAGQEVHYAQQTVSQLVSQAQQMSQEAAASLEQALSQKHDAEVLVKEASRKAYEVAKTAAESEVSRLHLDSVAYFSALARAHAVGMQGSTRPQFENQMVDAAAPYNAIVRRVSHAVDIYNERAIARALEAQHQSQEAVTLSKLAVRDQADGDPVAERKHLTRAHQAEAGAKANAKVALKIRRMAEKLNTAIPSYQQAAVMASDHAAAGGSGMQGS